MKRITSFFKKEAVLTIAWLLAIVSCIFVRPDRKYIDYIDFRSLWILWSLMVIMQGFKTNGVFEKIGQSLLHKTKRVWQLCAVLVFLCFFCSMLITNDVALITFVPFAILMLKQCDREDLLIPVIVLQTVAANLGSMLTPLGNPQNLYLYGISDMDFVGFVMCMLPFSVLSFVIITIHLVLVAMKGSSNKDVIISESNNDSLKDEKNNNGYKVICYTILFILALLVVLKLVNYYYLVAAVLILVTIMERNSIKNVDYALLFTFIGFFIFTGNMSRIEMISVWLSGVVKGKEIIAGVLTSQCISNVPAALLLSGFTDNITNLLIGVNVGGLGTLIASMASLISYKAYAAHNNTNKTGYMIYFTVTNIIYLLLLLSYAFLFTHS